MQFIRIGTGVLMRRWLAWLVVAAVAFLGIMTLSHLTAAQARAASEGTGITFDKVGYLGSFRLASGAQAYCVEIKVWEPLGAQKPVQTVSALPAFSGDLVVGTMLGMGGVELHMPEMSDPARMRQLNYIISKWGDTNDTAQAAAVALAVFQVRGDPIGYNDALQRVVRSTGGTAIVERAQRMIADAQKNAVAPVKGEKVKAPVVTLDSAGQGSVEYFAGTHTLTLTNAVFADSGKSARAVEAGAGGKLSIRGVKPSGWDAKYEVSVTADWATGVEGWRAELNLHEPTTPREQRVVTPTGMTTNYRLAGSARTVATVENTWVPSVSTQVHKRVLEVGETFTDTVLLEAAAGAGFWSISEEGSYMPITARGTLYGPFDTDPSVSPREEAPTDAPIAARVTLEATEGPGTYEVSTPEAASQSGFYTWQWRIDWEDQAEAVVSPQRTGQSALNRSAFPVKDGFGLASETHLVKQRLQLITRLIDGEVGLGWSLVDDVSVIPENFGGWLKDTSGENIPIVLRGTVYHSEQEPERAPSAPDSAREIASTTITAHDTGIFSSEAIPLPLDVQGYVSLQWCILEEDQDEAYQEYTREWCDDYGVPAETASVTPPTVTTKAQPEAVVGETMHDDAFVEGLLPHEASLGFTAYLYPKTGEPKYASDWRARGEVWTEKEISAMSEAERCTAQPVATTEPVLITEAGTHRSPEIVPRSVGTIHWVERLYAVDPTTNETELVHEGECGVAEETTEVTAPKPPALAETGAKPMMGAALGLVGIFLGIASLVTASQRRRSP